MCPKSKPCPSKNQCYFPNNIHCFPFPLLKKLCRQRYRDIRDQTKNQSGTQSTAVATRFLSAAFGNVWGNATEIRVTTCYTFECKTQLKHLKHGISSKTQQYLWLLGYLRHAVWVLSNQWKHVWFVEVTCVLTTYRRVDLMTSIGSFKLINFGHSKVESCCCLLFKVSGWFHMRPDDPNGSKWCNAKSFFLSQGSIRSKIHWALAIIILSSARLHCTSPLWPKRFDVFRIWSVSQWSGGWLASEPWHRHQVH